MHILLVDDHPFLRGRFARMVRMLRPDWTLHLLDSASHALAFWSTLAPGLVIVDLPGDDGFSLIKTITDRHAVCR